MPPAESLALTGLRTPRSDGSDTGYASA